MAPSPDPDDPDGPERTAAERALTRGDPRLRAYLRQITQPDLGRVLETIIRTALDARTALEKVQDDLRARSIASDRFGQSPRYREHRQYYLGSYDILAAVLPILHPIGQDDRPLYEWAAALLDRRAAQPPTAPAAPA